MIVVRDDWNSIPPAVKANREDKCPAVDEAWRYGFRWGPLTVERTAHIEGRGYVLTVRTERQSMQIYVSEKGQRLRSYEPVTRNWS